MTQVNAGAAAWADHAGMGNTGRQRGDGAWARVSAGALRLLSEPHRLLFFCGLWALVASMAWWALLMAGRAAGLALPVQALPVAWIHGWLFVFALVFFVFGFLFTALPRWAGAPPIARPAYGAVGVGLASGYALIFVGSFFTLKLVALGQSIMAVFWLMGWLLLANRARRAGGQSALHVGAALGVLGLGAALMLAGAVAAWTGRWAGLALLPQMGVWLFLAPLIFVVAHRMLPFFAAGVLSGYAMYRPRWSPPAALALFAAHGVALWWALPGLRGAADMALAAIAVLHLVRWRPWRAWRTPLLWSLFVAYAWLPVALVLSSLQGLAVARSGEMMLGLAPLHALTIGCITSMVFAMVTRVSLGHSGRALRMGTLSVGCFLALQGAAVARAVADLGFASGARQAWLLASVVCALGALLPWALRHARFYYQPRVDQMTGRSAG